MKILPGKQVLKKLNDQAGVSMADINGDGLLDIYVCNSGDIKGDNRQNELYINNGDLSFSEKGHEYGLDDGGSPHCCFFLILPTMVISICFY